MVLQAFVSARLGSSLFLWLLLNCATRLFRGYSLAADEGGKSPISWLPRKMLILAPCGLEGWRGSWQSAYAGR